MEYRSKEPGKTARDLIQVALCLVLVMVLFGMGLYSLLDEDKTFSVAEKRTLETKPVFTLGGLRDSSYLTQFDAYYSDTFPMRDWFIAQNRRLNRFYAYSDSKNTVLIMSNSDHISDGGEHLPLATDSADSTGSAASTRPPVSTPGSSARPPAQAPVTAPTEPVEQTQPPEPTEPVVADVTVGSVVLAGDRAMEIVTILEDVVADYAATVSAIADAVGEDVRVFSLVTPNAGEFYSPEDMHTGSHSQKDLIAQCYGQMSDRVTTVDAYSVLRDHLDEYIFFRTDHHWNGLGAYYAYTAFCEAAGFTPVALDQFETGSYDGFVGSLYNATCAYDQSGVLLENPDTVHYYRPIVDTSMTIYDDATLTNPQKDLPVIWDLEEDVSNKYLCFLGGDHPITLIETDVDNDRVCLVLKESYGNAFMPYLTSHYKLVIGIDPREFNREGLPSLDLAEFAQYMEVDDILVINYPIAVNNQNIVNWIGRLVGA